MKTMHTMPSGISTATQQRRCMSVSVTALGSNGWSAHAHSSAPLEFCLPGAEKCFLMVLDLKFTCTSTYGLYLTDLSTEAQITYIRLLLPRYHRLLLLFFRQIPPPLARERYQKPRRRHVKGKALDGSAQLRRKLLPHEGGVVMAGKVARWCLHPGALISV